MTEPLEPTIFWDRSRAQRDDECRRSRYWLTGYKERGIVGAVRPVYFDFGSIIAQAHHQVRSGLTDAGSAARTAEGAAYDAAYRSTTANPNIPLDEARMRASELACLAGALIAGFYVPGGPWDLILEDYEVAHAEVELTLQHAPGITFGCRPDLVLRRKSDGAYGYPDDKTTGNMDADWWHQWETDVQLQSGARAIKETLGLDITFVMVIAHYKGYNYKGEYRSPLVYGYRNQGPGGMMFTGTRPQQWKGWERFAVFQEMGYQEWITTMPREELMENFAFTRPIAIRPDLVDAWFAQRALREREIARATGLIQLVDRYTDHSVQAREAAKDALLNEHFSQNFKACTPFRRSPCPYRDACFLPHVQQDPIRSGLYLWREPHHDTDPLYGMRPPE